MPHDLDGSAPVPVNARRADDRSLVDPVVMVEAARRNGTRRRSRSHTTPPTNRDQPTDMTSIVAMAPAEPSPEEMARRHRAISLVGEHWEELSRRLRGWLGQACRDDDSLPGEVALTMIRRYANGNGRLVRHLRRNPYSNDTDDKEVLFGEAKWVYREILKAALKERDQARLRTELDETTASPDGSGRSVPFDLVDDQAGWGWDVKARPAATDTGNVEQLIGEIDVLLTGGERVWESLCVEGVLDQVDWTKDQKWTMIGMMLGFTVSQIAMVRQVKAKAPGSVVSEEATRQMMTTVRKKGRILLEAMSPLAANTTSPAPAQVRRNDLDR